MLLQTSRGSTKTCERCHVTLTTHLLCWLILATVDLFTQLYVASVNSESTEGPKMFEIGSRDLDDVPFSSVTYLPTYQISCT